MRDTFLKLCAEDAICKLDMPMWMGELIAWTRPSDHGTCITVLSGAIQRVSRAAPYDDEGTKLNWVELMETSIAMPAKITWAPFKTWIQTSCHDSKKCSSGVGNWQSTVNTIDAAVAQ